METIFLMIVLIGMLVVFSVDIAQKRRTDRMDQTTE